MLPPSVGAQPQPIQPPQMRNNFSAPMPFMALSSGNLATPAIMQRLGVAEMMRNAGMMNQPAPQPMQPTEPQMAPQAGMAPNEQMFARGGFAVKRAC